jgi:hypothetical protein
VTFFVNFSFFLLHQAHRSNGSTDFYTLYLITRGLTQRGASEGSHLALYKRTTDKPRKCAEPRKQPTNSSGVYPPKNRSKFWRCGAFPPPVFLLAQLAPQFVDVDAPDEQYSQLYKSCAQPIFTLALSMRCVHIYENINHQVLTLQTCGVTGRPKTPTGFHPCNTQRKTAKDMHVKEA